MSKKKALTKTKFYMLFAFIIIFAFIIFATKGLFSSAPKSMDPDDVDFANSMKRLLKDKDKDAGYIAMAQSDCFSCHDFSEKRIGPTFKEIALKYDSDYSTLRSLSSKVKTGSMGNWGGELPMTAHPTLNNKRIYLMIDWILKVDSTTTVPDLKLVSGLKSKVGTYISCIACHGQKSDGLMALKSPALAGQQDWYIKSQLVKFKNGHRGSASGDTTGALMKLAALPLSNKQMDDLSRQISRMKAEHRPATVEGNILNGKKLYRNCMACHGVDGKGNKELNSPSLLNQHDWYIVNQLSNFVDSKREHKTVDTSGKAISANYIPSEQEMKDLAAYINSLTKKKEEK
ncbi:MAG: cytochrome c [Lentisphaeria bacterium]|nr:cytochrome c [Lentisphaeria bacterium]NQZ66927.1 cytochrome c [Lentisphaeria bacterium]